MAQQRPGEMLTPIALQAEIDSLRDLRRRSLSTPGEGRLDPDLPDSPGREPDATSPLSPSSPSSAYNEADAPLSDQVSSLFWLPAHLHPEIAPKQFKEFIKEQTTPEALARRSASVSRSSSLKTQDSVSRNSSVGRRRSMLRHQVDPSSAASTDENSFSDRPPQRRGTSESKESRGLRRRGTQLDNLTIADLQKLEDLSVVARSGSAQGEEQLMKTLLERSMSLGTLDQNGTEGEGESPLVVPAPGSILRRSAISKIRKPSLLGDGGGHRFGPPRRPSRRMSDQTSDRSSVAEGSTPSRETISRDEKLEHSTAPFTTSPIHEDDAELPPTDQPATGKQPVLKLDTNNLDENSRRPPEHKRSVSSDSFLDAYLNPSPVDNRSSWPKGNSPTSPPESADNPDYDQQKPREWGSEQLQTGSAAYPPHSTSVSAPPTAVAPPPGAVLPPSHHSVPLVSSSVPSPSIIPVPTASDAPEPSTSQALATPSVKEKPEKKSTWARLGLSRVTSSIKDDSNTPHSENEDASSAPSSATSSKGKKRGKKSSAPEGVEDTSKEKDKEGGSGFFGGLFSSSKRKGEQTEPPQQVLLPTSTGCFREGDFVNFYRLPIHVERAVYRLSHIKLANPKRALYEQVLISNLMFWYLSLMHRENSIQPTAGMTSTEFEAAAGPPASALPSGSGARGAPNPPAPLDLPMPDQPTGPPGPSQAVISPLSSYPPANSAGGPDIPNRSTSSPDERQGRSNSRSQETHRPDQQHYPSQRNEPSLQHTSRRDESFKVVRGNSGRDVRANQSSNTAATLANHRKHEGKDVPWEQPRRDERNTSNVPEKPMQRPRRDASLQASNASATGRPLLHRSPEGSTTGHQEHIVV